MLKGVKEGKATALKLGPAEAVSRAVTAMAVINGPLIYFMTVKTMRPAYKS